jgi:DNA polymerase-3 subunit epsilon
MPDQTQKSPTFDIVWKEIKDLFINNIVVAHNAVFDESVLRTNLDYYGVDHSQVKQFCCTYKLYGLSLEKLCYLLDIPLDNHHDAGFDSLCCAKFYINYLNGVELDCSKLALMPNSKKESKVYHEQLKGDVLSKDLSCADPNNPFYDKKVVITGVFDVDRKELAIKLKSLGADVDTGISKKTNFVFVGDEAGPSKLAKIKSLTESGCEICILNKQAAVLVMEDKFSL